MAKRFIIILGYSLASDGSIQPILKSRLDAAISMYQPTDILLVCGMSVFTLFDGQLFTIIDGCIGSKINKHSATAMLVH